MNITRTMAVDVAKKMVQPLSNNVTFIKEEIKKVSYDAVIKAIPKDVMECYGKYKGYFCTTPYATLLNGTQEVRVDLSDCVPLY